MNMTTMHHENTVRLIGFVNVDSSDPKEDMKILLELINQGSLEKLLRKVTEGGKRRICLQVARGIAYLDLDNSQRFSCSKYFGKSKTRWINNSQSKRFRSRIRFEKRSKIATEMDGRRIISYPYVDQSQRRLEFRYFNVESIQKRYGSIFNDAQHRSNWYCYTSATVIIQENLTILKKKFCNKCCHMDGLR